MRDSAHEIGQDVWKQWILSAIAKIRSQKQRPSVQRICQAIGTHHKFHEDIVAEKLEEAVESGAVIKVYNKGLHSYKAPMAKRKIMIDKNTNLCKIVARAVHDLGECEGSSLKNIENYIQKFNNIELGGDVDFRAIIKSSIKKAVDAGFLIQEGKLYKKGRSLTTPRKSVANADVPLKVGDENCMHCKGTAQKNQNGVPEPLSSCKQCGGSLHTTCANIAAKCKTQSYVLLYMLVTKGSVWYCQNCALCDECDNYDKGPCLLQCSSCQKKFHLTCLDTLPDKKPKHPYRCNYCVKDGCEVSRAVSKKDNNRKVAENNKTRRTLSSESPPATTTSLNLSTPDMSPEKYGASKKMRGRAGNAMNAASAKRQTVNDSLLPTSTSNLLKQEQFERSNRDKYFKHTNTLAQQQQQERKSNKQPQQQQQQQQQQRKTFGSFLQQQQQQYLSGALGNLRKRALSDLSSSSSSSESEDDNENEGVRGGEDDDEDSSSSGSCSSSSSGSDTSDSSSESSDVDNDDDDDNENDDDDEDDGSDDDDDDDGSDDDDDNDNENNADKNETKTNIFNSHTTTANNETNLKDEHWGFAAVAKKQIDIFSPQAKLKQTQIQQQQQQQQQQSEQQEQTQRTNFSNSKKNANSLQMQLESKQCNNNKLNDSRINKKEQSKNSCTKEETQDDTVSRRKSTATKQATAATSVSSNTKRIVPLKTLPLQKKPLLEQAVKSEDEEVPFLSESSVMKFQKYENIDYSRGLLDNEDTENEHPYNKLMAKYEQNTYDTGLNEAIFDNQELPNGVHRCDIDIYKSIREKAVKRVTENVHKNDEKPSNDLNCAGSMVAKFNKLERCPAAIEIGRWHIETWYSSPFPQEYAR